MAKKAQSTKPEKKEPVKTAKQLKSKKILIKNLIIFRREKR